MEYSIREFAAPAFIAGAAAIYAIRRYIRRGQPSEMSNSERARIGLHEMIDWEHKNSAEELRITEKLRVENNETPDF